MASFCAACGTSVPADARFCPACGKRVQGGGDARPPLGNLTRPFAGRKLAGVCRGLANQYGWDVTLIRVLVVLLTVLVFPVGLVAYLVLWMMMPQELVSHPASSLDTAV